MSISKNFSEARAEYGIPTIIFGGILVLLIAVVLLTALLLYEAWAVVTIWGWLMVPVFNLPALTYPYAIMLACLLGLFKRKQVSKDSQTTLGILLSPVVLVGIAWIAKQFV